MLALRADAADVPGLEIGAAELLALVWSEHRVVVSGQLIDIYLGRLFQAPKGVIWQRLHQSLHGQIWHRARHRWLDDVPMIDGPYHWKDQAYISLAAAPADTLLVTEEQEIVEAVARLQPWGTTRLPAMHHP